jgi:hypothetical protein
MIGITAGFRLSYTRQCCLKKESAMTSRGQVFLGLFLLFCGGTLFLTNVMHINLWAVCCPAVLIFMGLFMLVPRDRRSAQG